MKDVLGNSERPPPAALLPYVVQGMTWGHWDRTLQGHIASKGQRQDCNQNLQYSKAHGRQSVRRVGCWAWKDMWCLERRRKHRGGWVGIQHNHRLTWISLHILSCTFPILATSTHAFLFPISQSPPAVFLEHFFALVLLPPLMLPPGMPPQFNPIHPSRPAQGLPSAGNPLCHLPTHLISIHLACVMCLVTFEVLGIQQCKL